MNYILHSHFELITNMQMITGKRNKNHMASISFPKDFLEAGGSWVSEKKRMSNFSKAHKQTLRERKRKIGKSIELTG